MHIAVVYQFARQADDIVDEAIENSELRTCLPAGKVENLELYETDFSNALKENFQNEFWEAIYNTIH
jgi:hypothetical protein